MTRVRAGGTEEGRKLRTMKMGIPPVVLSRQHPAEETKTLSLSPATAQGHAPSHESTFLTPVWPGERATILCAQSHPFAPTARASLSIRVSLASPANPLLLDLGNQVGQCRRAAISLAGVHQLWPTIRSGRFGGLENPQNLLRIAGVCVQGGRLLLRHPCREICARGCEGLWR